MIHKRSNAFKRSVKIVYWRALTSFIAPVLAVLHIIPIVFFIYFLSLSFPIFFFFLFCYIFFNLLLFCPFGLFYSFLALYLILMELFLCFDIFKQFCYLAKSFINTCKTYKYAKLKTSSLQNCILQKRKFKYISHEPNPQKFKCWRVRYDLLGVNK